MSVELVTMSRGTRASGGSSLTAWLLLLACGRPPDLSGFQACWLESASLVPDAYGLDLADGSRPVLVASAEWGWRPWARHSEQNAELLVEIPRVVMAGDKLPLDGLTGQYREGGSTLAYESRTLQGWLDVIAIDEATVELTVRGAATSPTVNLVGGNDVVLSGTVVATRTPGSTCR